MVANILKYRSDNLIILYYYAYSGLLDTVGVIIQNSMGLMKHLVLRLMGTGMECDPHQKSMERVWMLDGM